MGITAGMGFLGGKGLGFDSALWGERPLVGAEQGTVSLEFMRTFHLGDLRVQTGLGDLGSQHTSWLFSVSQCPAL